MYILYYILYIYMCVLKRILRACGCIPLPVGNKHNANIQPDAVGCSQMQLDAAGCSQMLSDAAICSRMQPYAESRADKAALKSHQIQPHATGCSRLQPGVARCYPMQQDAAGCSQMQLDAAG